ncbi:cell envelope integrity protein CreD [Variovorax sp. dw_954]|uniref:cell envelope integrity protein CreD n=1 Tax=Variovorax sp. dw_954 TaxID=2720078 RepID=UPI001BD29390|nr:cell envelope integrity protein CreD [Variovorax sp. dw_954]
MNFQALRNSILVKLAGLLLLTLLLCIPLAQIDALNHERGQSQREAAQELARTYTDSQQLIGPLLVVPYVERWMEVQRSAEGNVLRNLQRSKEAVHIVFPERQHLEGSLLPQERYRGIFKVPFYSLKATLDGGFAGFDVASVPHSETDSQIETRTPYIAFKVSDLRGLDGSPALGVQGESLHFAQRVPGLADDGLLGGGIHAPLSGEALATWKAGKPLPFELKLALVGQETLSMVPLGGETTAHLVSPWAHPSFGGRFLASERSITAQGFEARWRVSSLVTTAREQLLSGVVARKGKDPALLQSFDVSLAQPVNVYSMSTRAGKYGVLFIGLVIMAAFMFELFRKLRMHPVQYGLVGLSIALFFLMLLALSEKLAFGMAYAGAASASVLLLAAYFSAVLGGWRRDMSFGAYVAVLYGALYGLLASESNALLLGALLVFGLLAVLMLATRKVDWYALSAGAANAAGPVPSSSSAN